MRGGGALAREEPLHAQRRFGAVVGVAVEVEKWRLVLTAQLRRLAANPGVCIHVCVCVCVCIRVCVYPCLSV
jgi:hypothetical protein